MDIVRTQRFFKGRGIVSGPPKTHRSRRLVALSVETVKVLLEHRCQQLEHRFQLGPAYNSESDLVFANPVGGPMYDSTVRRAFYAMVKEAGLPHLRIHDLRHTSATLLLRAGVGAQVVSKRLGHAKVGFTLDTYAHVLPDQQRGGCSGSRLDFGRQNVGNGALMDPVSRMKTGGAYGIRTRDLRLERAASWAARRMRPMAAELGFEPRLTDSESVVLPLHHSAV